MEGKERLWRPAGGAAVSQLEEATRDTRKVKVVGVKLNPLSDESIHEEKTLIYFMFSNRWLCCGRSLTWKHLRVPDWDGDQVFSESTSSSDRLVPVTDKCEKQEAEKRKPVWDPHWSFCTFKIISTHRALLSPENWNLKPPERKTTNHSCRATLTHDARSSMKEKSHVHSWDPGVGQKHEFEYLTISFHHVRSCCVRRRRSRLPPHRRS